MLELEPRVASMVPGADVAVEVADMVLPSASVVVKSHCLVSAVLGRSGGLETLGLE